jgi:hypothetical protein
MSASSRRWDREPETEFDTHFFDLRESGYSGPIDQDGYAATSGDDARILRDMAAQQGEDTSWWTGGDLPAGVDQGHPPRGRALLFGLVLLMVVMVVITNISDLHP